MQREYRTSKSNNTLSRIAMAVFALLPMLHWYDVGLPIGLGDVLIGIVSIITIVSGKFNIKAYPHAFFIVWIYIVINWYYYNAYPDLKGILPGGMVFFLFALNVGSGIVLFDIKYLSLYMRWITVVAICIFLYQFFELNLFGNRYCFVPNFTGHFLYQDLSYDQLQSIHLSSDYPCAFFLEKSYMAYYLVIYLCIELFYIQNKNILFSPIAICIIFTLLILKSGSGLLGMIIPVGAKLLSFYRDKSFSRYFLLIISIPVIVLFVYIYISTELGNSMLSRQDEIYTEGTSGFQRVVYGYSFFDNLSLKNKLFGTPISEINDLIYLSYYDTRFALNGIQTPLMQLGIIGLLLWLIFYINIYVKTSILGRVCILVLLLMSLIEVTYLGAYMTLLTVIPCSIVYKKIKYK